MIEASAAMLDQGHGRRLAIMQPYFFPYIGYFQLVAAVDRFVFYDDVAFMKQGWINRNRLLLSGRPSWFTLPVSGASSNRKINELSVQPGDVWRRKMLASVRQSYGRAPYFEQAYGLLAGILLSDECSLSALARRSVVDLSRYMGLETEFVVSSGRYGNEGMQGAERVLDICRRERATEYHNLPGGKALYSVEQFAAAGVELCFVEPNPMEYMQMEAPFKPFLSMLDVLMFNERSTLLPLLQTESAR
ncbi:WbqC family protein [Pseudoxanthomonas japonensis]|uniref:WbqC family protein n=1 Tax=Pseudoxanthomonas japonensis TaxID=69284 RepID=UPI00374844EB